MMMVAPFGHFARLLIARRRGSEAARRTESEPRLCAYFQDGLRVCATKTASMEIPVCLTSKIFALFGATNSISKAEKFKTQIHLFYHKRTSRLAGVRSRMSDRQKEVFDTSLMDFNYIEDTGGGFLSEHSRSVRMCHQIVGRLSTQ